MSTSRTQDEEELVASLKEFVLCMGPSLLEAGSYDMAKDSLLHLEQNDDKFHRYHIVKRLRALMESGLGGMMDEELEKHSIHPNDDSTGQESLVRIIQDKVILSPQYKQLRCSLKERVDRACGYLLDNFEKELSSEGAMQIVNFSKHGRIDIISSDDESTIGFGSHSAVLFATQNKIKDIADSLDKNKSIQTRREALNCLSQISTMDVQNYEVWPQIQQGVQDALADSEPQIWNQSLWFIAASFSCSNSNTKDIYTALLRHLRMQFQSQNKAKLPTIQSGLDCKKPEIIKFAKSFRLMNEFQQQIPQYWVRYPAIFLEGILDSTLLLLAVQPMSASTLLVSPVHFIALIDPKASWFTKWMHGYFSRAPLLTNLEKHRAIVENAVKSCLDYVAERRMTFDLLSDVHDSYSKRSVPGDQRRGYYTGEELEFVYFCHSLYLLGTLLCYQQGRNFFPIKVRDYKEPVTVTKLVVSLLELLTEPGNATPRRSHFMQYDPCLLVTEFLKNLCSSEATCAKCMCNDDVTNGLLNPVAHWLNAEPNSGMNPAGDQILLLIADILSVILSTSCGRQQLLYGESQDRFTTQQSSAVHVLSQFVKQVLEDNLSRNLGPPPSKVVIGNLLFLCRQLYSTCEGLLVTNGYSLHTAVAQAWRVASREADQAVTPTPSTEGNALTSRDSRYEVLYEDSLRDNLLNFASTPKGLLLLQQTGVIDECVFYMCSRYTRKLQVSKAEKFGYGYMMSQVAATAAGMIALHTTGFTKTLIHTIWGALEVVDDSPVYTPKCWPVCPIDKYVRKPFTNLVNMLSSFPAVYEMLAKVPLPTKESYSFREIPETIAELFDRLVIVNSTAKIHSLFNYEQSHVFGLRLLSCLTCCLDTCLLLQTQYQFQDILLKCQQENTQETKQGTKVIMDLLTLERNYILVKTYLIGGPCERILPSRTLADTKGNKEVFSFPLFSSYPVPKRYQPTSINNTTSTLDNDLIKYLNDTKKSAQNIAWFDKCRKVVCSVLTSKPEQIRGAVLQDMLERCVDVISQTGNDVIFSQIPQTSMESVYKSFQLTALQEHGIELVVRYGYHLKVLASRKESTEKLRKLLKLCGSSLLQQQRTADKSNLKWLQSGAAGLDWFTATVFLMMNGNVERSWAFLSKFSSLSTSAYLWSHRLHSSIQLSESVMLSGIPPVFSKTCHYIELILQIEVPHVYTAFKMSGYAPAQICQLWTRQCFWNYLDWLQILHYLCVCIVLGSDYQIYLCVAILRFLKRDLQMQMQEKNLVVFLKEEPIRGFRVGDHLEYMQTLQNKYRKLVFPDMQNISQP